VIYRNLVLAEAISSPNYPAWQWLAKRSGRIAGLSLRLRLGTLGGDQLPKWMQPLQTLSSVPGVQLQVEWYDTITDVNHPCLDQWLKQYGQLISHLIVEADISDDRLKLREFAEAAAPCRSIDLSVEDSSHQVVDLADLKPVARSLQCLSWVHGSVKGATALTSMSRLVNLTFSGMVFEDEEPWGALAKLTNLKQLHLTMSANGDPSELSALTGLSSLYLDSLGQPEVNVPGPFSLSSLQPLSTLLQLEVLYLGGHACAATSLWGLAGLSSLKVLALNIEGHGASLSSLEGLSPGVLELSILRAPDLVSLGGIEGCISMGKLSLRNCGVSSLQPLRGLSSLQELEVYHCGGVTSLEGLYSMLLQSLSLTGCSSLTELSGIEHLSALKSLDVVRCGVTSLQPLSHLGQGLRDLRVIGCSRVQERVLELPHVQPTAYVSVQDSNVREVVLAGGLRRAAVLVPSGVQLCSF
jgi:Leucine-rich repeat (LRR) protein